MSTRRIRSRLGFPTESRPATRSQTRRAKRVAAEARRALFFETLEGRQLLATLTWVGDINGNWNSGTDGLDTNWDTNTLPASNDVLVFPAAASNQTQTNDTPAGNTYTLQFSGSGYTIGGISAINLGAGTAISDAAGGNVLSVPLTLSASSSISVTAGTLTINGNLGGAGWNLNKLGAGTLQLSGPSNSFANLYPAGGKLVLAGSSITTVSGSVGIGKSFGASGTLSVQDSAQLNISGELLVGDDNGYSGTVNQSGGTVQVGNRVRLAHWPNETSNYNLSAGSLTVTNALNVGWDGTGVFTLTGGTVTAASVVVDANGATGGTDTLSVQGGTLNVGAGGVSTVGSYAVNLGGSGGTLRATAAWSSSLPMTLSGAGASAITVDTNGFNVGLSGALGGSGDLNKIGTGTLTLSGGNTYAGVTLISAGTLEVGAAGTIGSLGGGAVTDNGTLIFNRTNTYDFAGSISGTGRIIVQRNGTLNLQSGANVNVGYLDLGNNNAGSGNGTLNVQDGATLAVSGSFLLGNPSGNAGTVNQYGGTVTFSGTGDNFRIGHWPSESSAYNLSGGVFNISGAGANLRVGWDGNGTLAVSGGTLNATNIVVGRNGTGTVNLSGGTVNAGYIGVSTSGSGSGTVNVSDTATLNVGNFFLGEAGGKNGSASQSGGTVTVSGQLRVGHWGSETSTYIMSGGTLNLTGTSGTNPFQGGVAEYNGAIYLGIDGTGIFNHSGGDVSAQALVLDNRGDTPAGTDTYTMTGGTLTLGTWGIQGNASTQINLGGGTVRASASWSSLRPMTLTGTNGDVTFDSNGNNISLSGILDGPGGLSKTGAGTLTLSGTNSFAGNVAINGGTLSVGDVADAGSNSHLGSGSAIAINGNSVLQFTGAAADAMNRTTTLSGSSGANSPRIEVTNAAGDLQLVGATISGSGQTLGKIGSGTVTFGAGTAAGIGGLYAAGGNFTLNGNASVAASWVTVGANDYFITGGGSGTLNVQDTAALTTGTINLGDNWGGPSQTNFLNQSGGTVTVTGNSGENAAIRLGHWPNETSTYNLSGGVLNITDPNADLAIATDGTGIFNQTGGAASSAGVKVNHRNAGGGATFTVSGGTYSVGSRGILTDGGPAAVNIGGSGGTIKAVASFSSSLPMTLSGAGAGVATFDTNGNTIALSGVLSGGGGLSKIGAGTLTLTAQETYTGDTTISGGLVSLATGRLYSNLGWQNKRITVNNGATVEIGGWGDGAGAGFGQVAFAADNIHVDNGTIRYVGGSEAGNVDRGFTIDAGGAILEAASNTWPLNQGRGFGIASPSGGLLTLTGTSIGVMNMIIPGTGAVTKTGTSTWTLSNANTFTGGTTVDSGTLLLGYFSGGGVGTIRGTLTVNANGTVDHTTANTFGWTSGQSVNVLNINGGTVGGANVGNHFWNSFQLNMTGGTLYLGGTLNEFYNPTITVNSAATTAQIIPVTGAAVFRLRDNSSALFNVADGSQDPDLSLSVPITQNGTSGVNKIGAGRLAIVSATNTFGSLNVAAGPLTLGATGSVTTLSGGTQVGNAFDASGGSATLDIPDGSLTTAWIQLGNTPGAAITAVVNQSGGSVRTTADPAESAGVRLGHYPAATTFYNLSGGTLLVDNGRYLTCAVDGTGTFNQTGGEATATRVVVNARGGGSGNGTLTVTGGRLNVGSGGIVNDGTGPAAVNVGGNGGTIRATANFSSSLLMTLSGSGASAATFDSNGNTITLTGVLGGGGGVNKIGAGTLTLTNANTYSGPTTVSDGTLSLDSGGSIANSSHTTVQSGATLAGTGTTGPLTIDNGGTHAPGTSPGITTVTGNYVENGLLISEIGTPSGSVPGTDYDQTQVVGNGSVTIGATATLNVPYLGTAGTFAPGIAQLYTIIDNDGAAAGDTTGTFSNYPSDGSTVTVDGLPLEIFYHGGDGNDVVLVNTAALSTVYVDDAWTGYSPGMTIADADPVAGGPQGAVYGINAFSGIDPGYTFADALNAVTVGGTVIVNEGDYSSQAVNISKQVTMNLQEDAIRFGSLDDSVTNATLNLNGITLTCGGNDSDTQFDSSLGGTGNLTKTGIGTLTLGNTGNTNTYSGLTTVGAGTLKLGSLTALGGTATGTTIQNGATLDLNGVYVAGNSDEPITVSGAGVGGKGAIINTGAVGYNQGFGNLTLEGDTTIGGPNRWDLRGGITFTGNNYTLTKIGNFQIAVTSPLNGADIVLNAGRFTIQTDNALGTGGPTDTTTVNSGAVLAYFGAYTVPEKIIFNGGSLESEYNDTTFTGPITFNADTVVNTVAGGHDITITGPIDGAGGLIKNGTSTLTLAGDNSYGGATTIAAGTVRTGHQNAFGATTNGTTVLDGATIELNSLATGINGGEVVTITGAGVGGNGAIVNTGVADIYNGVDRLVIDGSATIGGTRRWDIRRGYIHSASGTATLNKVGPNYIAVAVGDTAGLGDININQGTISFEASNAVGEAANTITVANGAMAQFWTWTPSTIANTKNVLLQPGGILRGGGTSTSSLNGLITLAAGSPTSQFQVEGTATLVVNSRITGGSELVKTDAGLLVLTNSASDYTGATTINAGTLSVSDVADNGSPSQLGQGTTIAINGNSVLQFTAAAADATDRTITLSGSSGANSPRIDVTNAAGDLQLVGGTISGSGQTLGKIGAGTLTLGAGTTTAVNSLFAAGGNLTLKDDSVTTAGSVTVGANSYFIAGGGSGTMNVQDNATLTASFIHMGDNYGGTPQTNLVNQAGGTVTITGYSKDTLSPEPNNGGIRIGHWPNETSTYNLSGGVLNLADPTAGLLIATDGTGTFNQSGGVATANFVKVNTRNNATPGVFTVSGGTFNLGSGGIITDNPTYAVNLGGSGGTLRATANWNSSLDMTLNGTDTTAITVDTNGFNVALSGALSGTGGGLNKGGSGTLTLSENNTYSGQTHVLAGTLALSHTGNNNLASSPLVTVDSGAVLDVTGLASGRLDLAGGQTLRGEGTVQGDVTALNLATVAPGVAAPGILAISSDVTLNNGSTFAVELGGVDAGSGSGYHDQLGVTDAVTLDNATLAPSLFGGFTPSTTALETFVIIDNGGSDAVSGTFSALPEGAPVPVGGSTLYITYTGSDAGNVSGNDVVLNSQPVVNGTPGPDVVVLRRNAADTEFEFSLNSPTFLGIGNPTAFYFNGSAGDDVLIVDFVNGDAIPGSGGAGEGVFFDGEGPLGLPGANEPAPTPGHGDVLWVTDSGPRDEDATYLPSASVPGAGWVTVDGRGVVTFTGLEPVDISNLATVTLTLPGGSDVVNVSNGFDAASGTVDALVLSGTSDSGLGPVAFESLHVWNVTDLTIDTLAGGSDGDDTVTIFSGDNAHGVTNVNITTGSNSDSVTFTGTLQVMGDVSVSSQNIAFNGGAIVATGGSSSVTLNAGNGAITTSGPEVDVAAVTLLATASTGIGTLAAAIGTQVTTLDATNSGDSGGIFITESAAGGDLTVRQARQSGASTEAISIRTTDGTLTLTNSGATRAAAGLIRLYADGGTGSHLQVNAAVTSSGGNIELLADQDVTADGSGAIAAGTGNVQIIADLDSSGPVGDRGTIQLAAGASVSGGEVLFSLADCDGWVNGNVTAANIVMGVDANTPEGVLRLQGGNNTFSGTTTVVEGTLLVNGKLTGPAVSVQAGGVLGGDGDESASGVIVGSVTVLPGGILEPGDCDQTTCAPLPGVLTVSGDVDLQPGSEFRVQLNGLTAGTQYDQLVLGGEGNLHGAKLDGSGGATLTLQPGFAIPVGAEFVIVSKLPAPVWETRFDGLPEGDFLTVAGVLMNISYFASDAGRSDTAHNDIVLTAPGRYDFDGFYGYTAENYMPISPFTEYGDGNTAGWQTLPPQYFERNWPDAPPYDSEDAKLKYDGQSTDNLGNPLTFAVDVVSGKAYSVCILTGDTLWNHDREQFQVYDANGVGMPPPLNPDPVDPNYTQRVDTWGAGAPDGSGVNATWGGGAANPGAGYYRWVCFTTDEIVDGPLDPPENIGTLLMRMADLGGVDPTAVILALDIRPVATVGGIVLTRTNPADDALPLSELPADGMTVDTYQGTGAPPFATITVTVSAGSPVQYATVTPDGDAAMFGAQVTADQTGRFTFSVLRPAALTNTPAEWEDWTITVQEASGLSRGTVAQRYVAPEESAPLRFDFGVSGSPLQADFLAVVPQTIYSAARGYGWASRVAGVDRKDPGMSALRRDLNYAKDATFKVDLPDGTYSVRIYHSNPKYNGTVSYVADQIQVIAEPSQAGQVIQPTIASIAAGTTTIQTLTVTVSGGALELQFKDLGGQDGNFVVSALEISRGGLPGEAPLLAAGDPWDSGAAAISTEQLARVAAEAAAWWTATGLTAQQAATLAHVQYAVADLGGAYLGLANVATNQIRIDDDAAMLGWGMKEEGGRRKDEGGRMKDEVPEFRSLNPEPRTLTPGIDLLTVVMHELGHLLGYEHTAEGLMAPVLGASPLPPSSFLPHPSSFILHPSSFILSPASRADDVFAALGRGGSEERSVALVESPATELLAAAVGGEMRRGDLRSRVSAGSETRAEQTETRAEPRRSRVQRYERESDECFVQLAVGEDAGGER